MPYAYQQAGQWCEILGAFATDDGSYPPGWAEAATPAERAAAGIVAISFGQLDPLPHQRKVGDDELVDVGGVPTRRGVFETISLDARKANMLAAIRDARWQHEQAGFTGPAGPVRSDDATQGKVTGAVQLFDLNPDLTTLDWELAPGVFASVTKAQLTDMGVAIGAHVQACFTRSRQLTEAVLAAATHAELTTLDLESGWPV